MDHVIEFILNYMEMDVSEFREEWTSGKFNRISDCPSYDSVKSYCDAIKALNRMDGRFSSITPSSLLE